MPVRARISDEERLRALKQVLKDRNISENEAAIGSGSTPGAYHPFFSGTTKKRSTFDAHLLRTLRYVAEKDPSFSHITIPKFNDYARSLLATGYGAAGSCLIVGSTETLWYPAIRTIKRGEEGRAEEYRLRYKADQKLTLDQDLRDAVQVTLRGQAAGKYIFQNGQLLHIAKANWWPPNEPDQRFILEAILTPHEYALFYTLTSTDHGRLLLKDRMRGWDAGDIIPELAGGVGINVAISCSDGAFIFGRRSATQGPRRNQLDIGAVEGLSVRKDLEERGVDLAGEPMFDVRAVALRALREEYGLQEEDVQELRFLGFGCDLQYSQWNILALALTSDTGAEIRRRNKYAAHGQEYLDTYPVKGGPQAVFDKMSEDKHPIWSCGIALAFFAMINLYGEKATLKASQGLDLMSAFRFM